MVVSEAQAARQLNILGTSFQAGFAADILYDSQVLHWQVGSTLLLLHPDKSQFVDERPMMTGANFDWIQTSHQANMVRRNLEQGATAFRDGM